ncbi:MAG TPA: trimeric intracellular cation channel family protein [Longimicrobium sp.]|nr:trimeric intracellular cation channel family protein [Longimicrobium sp.]
MIEHAFEMAGVAVFAISGALAAGRKSLDLLGVVVLAVVTSVGGGTLRDLLLDRHPIFWISEPEWLLVIAAAALLTVPFVRKRRPSYRLLELADALGLALFSVNGARIAEQAGLSPVIVVLMGTMTGVAGGAVRDVLTAEIPLVLRPGTLYATAAIAGIALYLAVEALGAPPVLAGGLGMCTVAAIRLASIFWNLRLPVFSLPDAEETGP